MAITEHAQSTITGLLDEHKIVLFMKGEPKASMCGFSATAVGILDSLDVQYASFNVLQDEEVREGIKVFGNWPTIPQLYIDKELIGGSDIIQEMFNSGELHEELGLETPDKTPPTISITDAAAEAIRAGTGDQPGVVLHYKIDDHWRSQFFLQPANGTEIKAESNGITLYMDILTAQKARGATFDFADTLQGSGLTIDLPEAPPAVLPLSVQEFKQKLDAGDDLLVVDVRNAQERARATASFAIPLDDGGMQAINARDKDAPIAFICHHGRSSLGAAEHYRKEGYTQLFNVEGGLDAYADQIDSDIPRY